LISEETAYYSTNEALPAISVQDLAIGLSPNQGWTSFDGYIDEVRISNVVRSFVNDAFADFTADPVSGFTPLEVQFTDTSIPGDYPITSWQWDFAGDGSTDSVVPNPAYTYSEAGSYTVSLTVSDGSTPVEEVKTDYISVVASVIAEFEATPIQGYAPLVVQFTNLSISNPLLERIDGTTCVRPLISRTNRTGDYKGQQLSVQDIDRDDEREIISWEWDFDGDGSVDSNAQNPLHVYSAPGSYTVTLTVTDQNDVADVEVKTDYITVEEPLTVDFEATPLEGYFPLEVQFTDLSQSHNLPVQINGKNGAEALLARATRSDNSKNQQFTDRDDEREIVGWEWDFDGDGAVDSNEQDPLYSYLEPGTYTVSLTVTDQNDFSNTEVKTDYIIVSAPIEADFEGTPVAGSAPHEVQFTDLSQSHTLLGQSDRKNINEPVISWTERSNDSKSQRFAGQFNDRDDEREIISWEWDYDGDGEVDSNEQNPLHSYLEPGTYTVSLTVTDQNEISDSEVKTDYITVGEPIVADFEATPLAGSAPLDVSFTDLSVGELTTWEWDFDSDGSIDSNDQNPDWTYTEPDTYTVTLTVSDSQNSDIEIKIDYIVVSPDAVSEWDQVPQEYSLHANFPNPFNPVTTISFGLPVATGVCITIYNLQGQPLSVLVDQVYGAGYHQIQFDGTTYASGFYLYHIQTAGFKATRKMLLLQ